MPLLKTKGIVLKAINLGESDKIITLFTDKMGKVQAVAHGARKSKSKLLSPTQVFCYGEYVLYKGKNLYTINECDIIESFQGLLGDLYTLTYVSYLIELADALVVDEEPSYKLFGLLLKSMYLMCDKTIDRELLARVFELKAMSYSGYMPSLRECSCCGEQDLSSFFFSNKLGGLICENCRSLDTESMKVDGSTISVLRYFLRNKIDKVRYVKVTPVNRSELKKLLTSYIKYYLDRDFKSLEFLNDVKM